MIVAILTTMIGLIGGFILSALLWYITVHLVRPQIIFSNDISKIVDATGRDVYRIKIRNAGRRRGVIDMSIRISVRYPAEALRPKAGRGNFASLSLNVEYPNVWRLVRCAKVF
jgi:hypothetical protein